MSRAATGASMSLSASSGTVVPGSTVAVAIRADSGTDPVNSVQASLTYNASQMQFVSITEGGIFPIVSATSTTTGVVRVGRAIQGSTVTGANTIVTVNFKVLATSGTTSLNLDPAYSFVVRTTDSSNILQTVTGATYTVSAPTPPTSSAKPIFTLTPATGSYAVGATVPVVVRLSSAATAVTTVEPVISYPTATLQYLNTTEGTAFPTVQRTKDSNGLVDIIRGITGGGAGITGDHTIVTVNFKVLAAGSATLALTNASAAYDNSGTGTNVLDLAGSKGAVYTLTSTTTTTPPPVTPPTTTTPPAAPAQAANTGTNSSVKSSSGASTLKTNTGTPAKTNSDGATQVQGEVAITPLEDATIIANNPGDSMVKVEYWLGKKRVATKTVAPFTYNFDTKPLKNGTYSITVKTFYKSGTVDSNTDKLAISNPVTFSYVMKHYSVSIISVVVILSGLMYVAWRYLFSKHSKGGDSDSDSTGTEFVAPFDPPEPTSGGPVASDPTVISPNSNITPDMEMPETSSAISPTMIDMVNAPAPVPAPVEQASTPKPSAPVVVPVQTPPEPGPVFRA